MLLCFAHHRFNRLPRYAAHLRKQRRSPGLKPSILHRMPMTMPFLPVRILFQVPKRDVHRLSTQSSLTRILRTSLGTSLPPALVENDSKANSANIGWTRAGASSKINALTLTVKTSSLKRPYCATMASLRAKTVVHFTRRTTACMAKGASSDTSLKP